MRPPLVDAQMYQEAADAAEDEAEKQATGAGTNYMDRHGCGSSSRRRPPARTSSACSRRRMTYDLTDEKDAAAKVAKCRDGYRCSG